jgi:uroporphyrinogen-III synthase
MRILITRPEEDAAEFAGALTAAGHEGVVCPLLEIVFPPAAPLSFAGVAALIVTSRNGLRGLARDPIFADGERVGADSLSALRALPVYCVGEATGRLAREMGFTRIHCGAGGARDLIPLIEAHSTPASGELLHLGGEQLAFDLPGALARRGYRTRLETVYRAQPASRLPSEVVQAIRLGEIGGAFLMSPRTARILVELFRVHGLVGATSPFVCYCLSPAVAQALGTSGEFIIHVAQMPNVRDILALVGPKAAH